MFAYSPWACNRRGEEGAGLPEWEASHKEDRGTVSFLEELGSLGNPVSVTRGDSIPCWLGDWCWGGGHQGGKDAFPGELASYIEANTQIVLAKPLAA